MVKNRFGAMVIILEKDMVTIEEEPKIIVPGVEYVLPEDKILEEKIKF